MSQHSAQTKTSCLSSPNLNSIPAFPSQGKQNPCFFFANPNSLVPFQISIIFSDSIILSLPNLIVCVNLCKYVILILFSCTHVILLIFVYSFICFQTYPYLLLLCICFLILFQRFFVCFGFCSVFI